MEVHNQAGVKRLISDCWSCLGRKRESETQPGTWHLAGTQISVDRDSSHLNQVNPSISRWICLSYKGHDSRSRLQQLCHVLTGVQWLWEDRESVCVCVCVCTCKSAWNYAYMCVAIPKLRFISNFSFKFNTVTMLGTDLLCQTKSSLSCGHLPDSGHILFHPGTAIADGRGNTPCGYSLRKVRV